MKANVDVFNQDAHAHGGYVYSTNGKLSSEMATRNLADLVLDSVSMEGRSVVDVGCGDGYFTELFFREGRPASITGIDPVPGAIAVARGRIQGRPLRFVVGDGQRLPWRSDSFDLGILHCVLHHAEDPRTIIREVLRLAPEVLIVEPNGNNLGLKVIEKASRYHREHEERSFRLGRMLRWIRECEGVATSATFHGLVPFFCPDRMARLAKVFEPHVERWPVLSVMGCAVYAVVVRRA
jgi:ubiquinone/menaquinone biosynthesis C-methylase UbiE